MCQGLPRRMLQGSTCSMSQNWTKWTPLATYDWHSSSSPESARRRLEARVTDSTKGHRHLNRFTLAVPRSQRTSIRLHLKATKITTLEAFCQERQISPNSTASSNSPLSIVMVLAESRDHKSELSEARVRERVVMGIGLARVAPSRTSKAWPRAN